MKNQKVLLPDGQFVLLNFNARNNEDAFVWQTHKGDYLLVTDMATPHLVNSVRMLFNHTVPPALRVGKFIRRPDVFEWSPDYKAAAMEALLAELGERADIGQEDRYELDDMARNTDFYLRSLGV